MTTQRKIATIILLAVLPCLFLIASVCIGRYSVSVSEVLLCIRQWLTGIPAGVSSETYAVVTQIRLPRAFFGIMVGAALSVSGAAFQGLFRNPLVSSGILGVSSGAGFGAALSILLFSSVLFTPIFAFVFGVVAVVLSYIVGKLAGTNTSITLVLGGTIIQSIFGALLSLVKYVADTDTQLPSITFWMMGSLASTRTADLLLAGIPILVGILGLLLMRWRINVLSMGDREARTLGLHVGANKAAVISFATLATAGAVSISGVVGWIGLVVPHMGRMLIGNDNRWLIPTCISLGGCFALAVDTICRTLVGTEIPLSVVSALVGGPFFIYLLKKTKGGSW
ncbi:MAG: iron ABC transporter permease [Coriobacteriia bacterium]|nr:iron ABC transporter permease [Coriobacteriia bacterium]